MDFLQKMGYGYFLMLVTCAFIIVIAEYLFLSGDYEHGIFVGLWAPMLMGIMIFLKQVENGSK